MKEKMFEYLKQFMLDNNWMDEHVPEQARSFFTTLCFMCGIYADTAVADNMLLELYNDCGMEYTDVSYDEFDLFMCELIV